MNINYEHYKIFYYVALYKNFTQAASALYSNQPNVSRAMKQLEHEIGCTLIIRTNRGITLTTEGEQLYKYVAQAFEQLRIGEAELQKHINMQKGTILIGATETALHLYLLDFLSSFHQSHPDIRFKIYNYSIAKAVELVATGQLDFSIVTTPSYYSKPLVEVPLMSFTDKLVCGTQFAELTNRIYSLSELSTYPLIGLEENTNTFQFYNKFYLENDLIFKPDIEVATTDLVLPMVENNLGIGYLPSDFAISKIKEGKLFEIKLREHIPDRQVCFIYDRNRVLSLAAQEMKKYFTK